jgi:hypothetical protein
LTFEAIATLAAPLRPPRTRAERRPAALVERDRLVPEWQGKGIVNEANRARARLWTFGGRGRPLYCCYDKPLRAGQPRS